MIRIALIGGGRMGQAIMQRIAATSDLQLVGVCVRSGTDGAVIKRAAEAGLAELPLVVSDPVKLVSESDVVIDFSLPAATPLVLKASLDARKPLVSGVTGLDPETLTAFRDASLDIPLLYDRNMSIGIAVMHKLLRQAARSLDGDFTTSVAEIHHRHKVDAPSGTALKLGEAVAISRGQVFTDVYHYDPDGSRGQPPAEAIVFHASRVGENPGEHTVSFASGMESLELKHKVTNRQVFADGALRAARWLVQRPPGLYSVADIVEGAD